MFAGVISGVRVGAILSRVSLGGGDGLLACRLRFCTGGTLGFTGGTALGSLAVPFFSFVAVWRNKGAFGAFVVGWVAVAFAVSSCAQLLQGALGEQSVLASLVLSPLSLAMLTALYGSIWATYRDPIRDEGTAPGAP